MKILVLVFILNIEKEEIITNIFWRWLQKLKKEICCAGQTFMLCNSTEEIAFSLCAFVVPSFNEIHDLTIHSLITKFKLFKLQALLYKQKHFLQVCIIKTSFNAKKYDREKNVIYFFSTLL